MGEGDVGSSLIAKALGTMLISLILGFGNEIARISKHMVLAKGVVVVDVEVATELGLLTILHYVETSTVPQRCALCISSKARVVGRIIFVYIVTLLLSSNTKSGLQVRDNCPFCVEVVGKLLVGRFETRTDSGIIQRVGNSIGAIGNDAVAHLCPTQHIALAVYSLPVWVHLHVVGERTIGRIGTVIGNHAENVLKQKILATIREAYVT